MKITIEMRDRIMHVVEEFSHLLSPQGPIRTFIHHNTLHGFEHLEFEKALGEARNVLGGSGYLPLAEYQRFHRAGRIAESDLQMSLRERFSDRQESLELLRLALVHNLEAIEPETLRWKVLEENLVNRFREDMPLGQRQKLEQAARVRLDASRMKVGVQWTLAHWIQAHTHQNISDEIRTEIEGQYSHLKSRVSIESVERHLEKLKIPHELRGGYLKCIDSQYLDGTPPNLWRIMWLQAECRHVEYLAQQHSGMAPTYSGIFGCFGKSIESYAVWSLWQSSLAAFGTKDPFPPERGFHSALPDEMQEHFRKIQIWGGVPIPVSSASKAALQRLIEFHLASTDDPKSKAVQLCWTVLHGLTEKHLDRTGFEALETLVSLSRQRAEDLELILVLKESDPRQKMFTFAEGALKTTLDRVGRDQDLVSFVRGLTGEDLDERINPVMIKSLAAFLDEGTAAWQMPGRVLGFYDAWKSLAGTELFWSLEGLVGARDELLHLPALAVDSVIQILRSLQISEDQWNAYLARVLIKLPGWSAMLTWRSAHPDYKWQQAHPIELVQMLAVRLFYDSQHLKKLCKQTWQIKGNLPDLKHYFESHLAEFFVRQELFAGRLPEYLAIKARALTESRFDFGADSHREWETLGEIICACREDARLKSAASEHAAHDQVWRFFNLAQLLGLDAGEVNVLSKEKCDSMIAALDALSSDIRGAVWQTAYEYSYRDQVLNALAHNRDKGSWKNRDIRPRAQIAFCIDDREESFRRSLEEINPDYETLGVAGFFGVAMNFKGLDDSAAVPLCPIVVTPTHEVAELAHPNAEAESRSHNFRFSWRSVFHEFSWEAKRNLVASYFVIDLIGWLTPIPLLGRLLMPHAYARMAQKLTEILVPPIRTVLTASVFSDVEQADRLEGILKIMGLVSGMSRLVVLCGHGSNSLNNPHLSAYDCGACGGKHGGPNARLFAIMVNRPEIRTVLRERGIKIPEDTWFVGAEHDTCSEKVTYYDLEDLPATHQHDFAELLSNMNEARHHSARERCRRLKSAPKDAPLAKALKHIEARAADFSQARPELGHATNACAIVGRRALSQGIFLDRRAFLISYDPASDPEGGVLEKILLAVGPVCAGISLVFYFSSVDARRYGCDSKIAHNVTGLVGVMEGACSDLRTGLPRQMTEIHEPMRLQMIVEAKASVLAALYERCPTLKTLFGNGWMHLIAVDPDTSRFKVFKPGAGFVDFEPAAAPLATVKSSAEWYGGKTDLLAPARIVTHV